MIQRKRVSPSAARQEQGFPSRKRKRSESRDRSDQVEPREEVDSEEEEEEGGDSDEEDDDEKGNRS